MSAPCGARNSGVPTVSDRFIGQNDSIGLLKNVLLAKRLICRTVSLKSIEIKIWIDLQSKHQYNKFRINEPRCIMNQYVLLLNPGHNRVYYKSSQQLSEAEFSIVAKSMDCHPNQIKGEKIAGVFYLTFVADKELSAMDLVRIAKLSFVFALYEKVENYLRPIEIPNVNLTGISISSLLKYTGKTNELFTRMMINVAASSIAIKNPGRLRLLDPIAGKGTTLFEGLTMGYDCYGIEIGEKAATESYNYLKKYLEIEKIRHKTAKQRQSGPNKSYTAIHYIVDLAKDKEDFKNHQEQHFEMVNGDSIFADQFFRKNSFHILAGDLPYGVQHGNVTGGKQSNSFTRNPKELVKNCLPSWKNVLKPGGVLVLAWNTNVLPKKELATVLEEAGLTVLSEDSYNQFSHRVDGAIMRDILIARK